MLRLRNILPCIKGLFVIILTYGAFCFIFLNKVENIKDQNHKQLEIMESGYFLFESVLVDYNYKPCQYVVVTAMCRGVEPKHKYFPEQLSLALGMFKSILLREKYFRKESYSNSCIELLVITEQEKNLKELLRELLKHGYDKKSYKHIRFTFVPASYPAGCEHFRDFFHPCASIRLFLDKLLPNYDSVLYVDTDVIFLQYIQILWEEIENFAPKTWAAFGPDQYGIAMNHVPFYGDRGLNSGVAFLNLTKMRQSEFSTKILTIEKIYGPTAPYPDQDFLNVYFNQNPGEIKYLNCGRNYVFIFCGKGKSCEYNEIEILHGAARRFSVPTPEPIFRSIFRIILRTRLDLDITTKEFAQRFEKEFDLEQNIYYNSSNCFKNVYNFKEMILKNIKLV